MKILEALAKGYKVGVRLTRFYEGNSCGVVLKGMSDIARLFDDVTGDVVKVDSEQVDYEVELLVVEEGDLCNSKEIAQA